MTAAVTILILTLNEEVNLPACLQSVVGWAADVLVLDSGSTDRTVALAEAGGAKVFHRPFDTYAAQRTYAVRQLPIQTEWVLFLDADETLHDEIKACIEQAITTNPPLAGYLIRLRFYFMNRWIRYGGYAEPQKLVLFRRTQLLNIERLMNELVFVDGPTATLNSYIIHYDRRPVSFWYEKHVRYSLLQAQELQQTRRRESAHIRWSSINNKRDRRRWLKERIWDRLPIWVRPFLYFFQRYFLLMGFLDGRAGFIYHFSHAFLYPFMIASIYTDDTRKRENAGEKAVDFHSDIAEAFGERYQQSADFKERFDVWVRLLDQYAQPGHTVLDAGCGTGIFSHYLGQRGCEVLGIDGSEEMVRLAKQQAGPNEQFEVAMLPTPHTLVKQPVNTIVCSSVLEYVPDLQGALETLDRQLQSGGYMILSLPNRRSVYRSLERISFWLTRRPAYLKYVHHYGDVETVAHMLGNAYRICTQQTFGGTNTVARLLRGILPARFADTLFIAVYQKK
ncbi:methyltransferase domain-containing protein [Fibrella arboris]|uniref:methyltransferase domain-containing protein n=1 Tax=Fibrella arboris TaxID=3242486 RepID=UPI00351FE439